MRPRESKKPATNIVGDGLFGSAPSWKSELHFIAYKKRRVSNVFLYVANSASVSATMFTLTTFVFVWS